MWEWVQQLHQWCLTILQLLWYICSILDKVQSDHETLLHRTDFPHPHEFDEGLLEGLRPQTRKLYLGAIGDFNRFLVRFKVSPDTRADSDEAIVLFWRWRPGPPAKLERLLAALERVWPQCKGHLPWAQAQLRRARYHHPVQHTMPLRWDTALLLALLLANQGWSRVGGLLLLQWCFGLRPSEALNLRGGRLVPRLTSGAGPEPVVLLGVKRLTKANRRQFVIADSSRTPWANFLVTLFSSTTGADTLLTAVTTVTQYNRLIRLACRGTGVATAYTAHSPRSGWATAMRLAGMNFVEIQEKGRWSHPQSLRIYLDVVGTLAVSQSEVRVSRWATWLNEDLPARFPWWTR